MEMASRYNASDPLVPLSISIGFAIRENSLMSVESLYGEADANMYQHKNSNSQIAQNAIIQNLMKTSNNSEQNKRLHKLMELLKSSS